jgi:hypothetical protein
MDPTKKATNAASTVAEGVKDAAETLVDSAAQAVSTIRGSGQETGDTGQEQSRLREVDPDPGNLSGVHDTAGDTTDHA